MGDVDGDYGDCLSDSSEVIHGAGSQYRQSDQSEIRKFQ